MSDKLTKLNKAVDSKMKKLSASSQLRQMIGQATSMAQKALSQATRDKSDSVSDLRKAVDALEEAEYTAGMES